MNVKNLNWFHYWSKLLLFISYLQIKTSFESKVVGAMIAPIYWKIFGRGGHSSTAESDPESEHLKYDRQLDRRQRYSYYTKLQKSSRLSDLWHHTMID